MSVSRNDHQRGGVDPSRWGSPRMAMIRYESSGASCSCGWLATARRLSVLEDKIDRHATKRHDGRVIRL